MRRRTGFTLIEVLIVIVVIAILAAIVIPRLLGAGRQAKEAALKATLQEMRNAVALFQAQCGCYPTNLSDMMGHTAPATGTKAGGGTININADDYQGPYLTTPDGEIPDDPIDPTATWSYTASLGELHSGASGSTLDGIPYSDL
jgi:general secretion pathway protein G